MNGGTASLRPADVPGPPGPAWCARWTEQVDAVLRELLGDTSGVAVVALGGYARRELAPASDVDLVLLHDGWGRTDLEGLVAQLCYPLWDAGLSVGHAVRTPVEAAAAADERIDTATAVLDRRLVAGDPGLLDAFAARVRRWSRRHARKGMLALAEETRSRHARHGPIAGLLEPNLKEGAGGLRDIHALRWAAAWVVGAPALDGLVTAGYLSATDRSRLAAANATLLTARCVLHQLDTGTRGREREVLRIQWHDDVAAAMGYSNAQRGDGEAFLRDLLLAMRTVAHLHDRVWPLLVADTGGRLRRRATAGVQVGAGLTLHQGVVELDPAAPAPDTPWRLVAAAAQHGAPLGRTAVAAITTSVGGEGAPWTSAARTHLAATLFAGAGAAAALRDADVAGLLTAAIPDWDRVRARAQRNALHRFDLDTHGARAVGELHRLRAEDENIEAVWQALDDPLPLLLATWLHDVGKAWPGDHSEAGAEVVTGWLTHMGFGADTRQQVAVLIRRHLLLPDVATRRDLDDPASIAEVAQLVNDVATIDALYLLSLADSRATGPAAWSTWKDSLLARLHREVRRELGAPLPAAAEVPPLGTAGARDGLAALRRTAPPVYFDVAGQDQVAAHAGLLPAVGVRADVRDGSVPETSVVSVAAEDRDALLADCTGVLAAFGAEVHEARAFSAGGVALSWFVTTPVEDPGSVVSALERLDGTRTGVADLVGRRRWGTRRPAVGVACDVTVGERTVEVEAPDSPALLYRLCLTLAEQGYGVSALRVSTLGAGVFDVFDLTEPIAPGNRERLRQALLASAEPDTGSGAIVRKGRN